MGTTRQLNWKCEACRQPTSTVSTELTQLCTLLTQHLKVNPPPPVAGHTPNPPSPFTLPEVISAQVTALPPFYSDNPESAFKFLLAFHKLNAVAPTLFPNILQNLAVNPRFPYIASYTQTATAPSFQDLADKMKIKFFHSAAMPTLEIKYLQRMQGPSESFRAYVDSIKAANLVLARHDDAALIDTILSRINDATHRDFGFAQKPSTLSALDGLVEHVDQRAQIRRLHQPTSTVPHQHANTQSRYSRTDRRTARAPKSAPPPLMSLQLTPPQQHPASTEDPKGDHY